MSFLGFEPTISCPSGPKSSTPSDKSRDSSAGIETGSGMDNLVIFSKGKRFLYFPQRPDRLWGSSPQWVGWPTKKAHLYHAICHYLVKSPKWVLYQDSSRSAQEAGDSAASSCAHWVTNKHPCGHLPSTTQLFEKWNVYTVNTQRQSLMFIL
jgi:hypothetical protein